MPNPELSTMEHIRNNQLAIAATTFLATVTLGAAARAEAAPVEPADPAIEKAAAENTHVTEMETTTNVLVGHSRETAKSAARAIYVGNFRTVSAAKIREARRAGECKSFTGAQAIKAGIKTQGYMGTGTGYAQENRPSEFCDLDGDGTWDVRTQCGNKAKSGKPDREKAKATIWVNNLNKQKIQVKSHSEATAQAACELKTAGGVVTASAYGHGEGSASAWGRLKNVLKGKGKLKGEGYLKLMQQSVAGANAKASSFAFADAKAECRKDGGEVVPPTPPIPPVNAPPTADIEEQVHSVTEDEVLVKCYVGDPDGLQDIKSVSMTESGTGSFVSDIEQIAPGVYAREFAAGPVEGEAEATCTVTDKVGQQASDTETWPIESVFTPLSAKEGK